MMRPKFRISMRSIGLWSCFIVLMGLSGFRWDVGVDFMNYYVQFGDDLMNEMLLERIEIGNHAVKYLLQLNGFTDGRYWIWVRMFLSLEASAIRRCSLHSDTSSQSFSQASASFLISDVHAAASAAVIFMSQE